MSRVSAMRATENLNNNYESYMKVYNFITYK